MAGERRTLKPGKRLNIPDRVRKRERQLRNPGSDLRNSFNEFMANRRIEPPNENIDVNTVVGGLVTFAVYVAEDYAPARAGASTSITDVQQEGDKLVYTIDVNAPLESQARFKSILASGTGITSLWIDNFKVRDVEVVKVRPARDTYRYEIEVDIN